MILGIDVIGVAAVTAAPSVDATATSTAAVAAAPPLVDARRKRHHARSAVRLLWKEACHSSRNSGPIVLNVQTAMA